MIVHDVSIEELLLTIKIGFEHEIARLCDACGARSDVLRTLEREMSDRRSVLDARVTNVESV